MTDLLFLQNQIQETAAEVARLHRALAAFPDSPSLAAMTQSVVSYQQSLESEYLRKASAIGTDVCSYRIFGVEDNPPISALAGILGNFQTLFSVVYSALQDNEPKHHARLSADVISATSLGFGYSFAGSVGVVLTLRNERMLFGETLLDDSFKTIFTMANAETPGAIANIAERVGSSAVRAMYKWSKVHATFGLGADIGWRRDDDVRAALLLQAPELVRLTAAIERTGAQVDTSERLLGMLVGIDTARRTFRLELEGELDIRGGMGDALSFEEPARVPARYEAWLTKRTRARYAMDADEITWTLEKLVPA